MAGKRKGGPPANKRGKSKKYSRTSCRREVTQQNWSEDENDDGHRVSTRSRGRDNSVDRVSARFVEDDAVVEMVAEGQTTEFAEEEATGVDDNEGVARDAHSQATETSDSEDEVILNSQASHASANNNATMYRPDSQEGSQEGEIPDSQAEAAQDAVAAGEGPAVTQLKLYVDRKFEALSRMVDLERQLSEKNRELDLLKAKGKESSLDNHRMVDGENNTEMSRSEVTIYKNAVEKEKSKRGSSSSEDAIDTSNELMEVDQNLGIGEVARELQPNDIIVEREIAKARELEKERCRSRESRDRDRPRDRYYDRAYTCSLHFNYISSMFFLFFFIWIKHWELFRKCFHGAKQKRT